MTKLKKANIHEKISTRSKTSKSSLSSISLFHAIAIPLLAIGIGMVYVYPSHHSLSTFIRNSFLSLGSTSFSPPVVSIGDPELVRSCQVDAKELTGFLSLQNQEVPGQHILCFPTDILDNVILYRNSDPNKKLHFNVSNHMHTDITTSAKAAKRTTIATGKIVSDNWWQSLHSKLEQSLNLRNRRYPVQPWALFTKDGERLVDETTTIQNLEPGSTNQLLYEKMIESGVLLLFEGGQWIWPGISIEFRREITLTETTTISSQQSKIPLQTRNVTLVTLALNPLVLSVQGFLSDEECDYIQQMATPSMQYSDVTLMDKDKGRPASDFRTSQSTFLGGSQHPELDPIDHRTSSLVKIPRAHQEYVQVLRYGHTEKYDAHHDYFDPRLYQNDPSTMHLIQHGRKNRLATVFWYLTDVAEGGETIFPRAHRGPHPRSMQDCSAGLKVKPERGKVIIFYSMTPEGSLDEYSLHGACPVKEGIKWAANKWVWNQPTGFYPLA